MGMSRHDAYYEPDDYDDRSDEIDERSWELMKVGGKYDYRTSQAVYESMGDLDTDQANALQDAINTNDYEIIGRKVMMLALDYMEKFARDEVEGEIND
jgi:hypothetical protein